MPRTPILTEAKDPDDILDYRIDWGPLLDDDVILSSVWLPPDGIQKDAEAFDATTTTVWLSGGESPHEYYVLNRIMTVGGRQLDQTMIVAVRNL